MSTTVMGRSSPAKYQHKQRELRQQLSTIWQSTSHPLTVRVRNRVRHEQAEPNPEANDASFSRSFNSACGQKVGQHGCL